MSGKRNVREVKLYRALWAIVRILAFTGSEMEICCRGFSRGVK